MFKFEDVQAYGKQGLDVWMESAAAMTKGLQTVAQEVSDFSRKSFETSTAVAQSAAGLKSFDQIAEVQQNFVKQAYESYVAEATKLGEIYVSTAKEAYRPFEAKAATFGYQFNR